MRLVVTPFFCLLGLCVLADVNCLAASTPSPAKLLESSPIRFEPNSGLQASPIRWTARGRGYSFAFTDRATLLRVADRTVRLAFPGANRRSRFQGEQRQRASTNYFLGLKNNEQKRLSVPAFARLRETGVYRGIDVVYYGNGAELEYDFEIAPGADPSQIRMRFDGADAVSGVRLIQIAGDKILGGAGPIGQYSSPAARNRVDSYFLLDTAAHTRANFANYDALTSAAQAAGIAPHLEPIFLIYSRYRYTWFDFSAIAVAFVPLLGVGLLLGRRIWLLRLHGTASHAAPIAEPPALLQADERA